MATKKFSDRFKHTLRSYTLEQARALALHGAGFNTTNAVVNPPAAALTQLGLLQIDTVNVFARAHTMPAFSRFGLHPAGQLQSLMSAHEPTAIEYWAHEASVIPTADYALFGWRRAEYIESKSGGAEFWRANQKLVAWIKSEIRERGPLTVVDLEHEANRAKGGWWGWSDVKRLTVIAFLRGELLAWGRRGSTRVFDLAENHPEVLQTDLSYAGQQTELLRRASRVLGIAREQDLADYYRMTRTQARPLIRSLVESGELEVVKVGAETAYLASDYSALEPSGLGGAEAQRRRRPVLLSPFDPLVWFRPRIEWLWDFHYRIEIYTPAAKRQFGYYSLPLLFDDQLVGRVDLKADRKAKSLIVRSAWYEAETFGKAARKVDIQRLARLLPATLREAAAWQGCETIRVENWGNLSEALERTADFA